MIQRQQTLWLILSAACAALTFKFPFYEGTRLNDAKMIEAASLDSGDNFFLLILAAATIVVSLITIFQYTNRSVQLKLAIVGLLLSLGLIAVYFKYVQAFNSGSMALWCLFTFGTAVGFIMAIRGIRNDQRLVKSLDKLR